MAVSGFLTAQICVLGALVFPRSGSRRLRPCGDTSCVPGCLRFDRKKTPDVPGKGTLALSEKDAETKSFLAEKAGEERVSAGEKLMKTDNGDDSLRRGVWRVVSRKEVWVLCVNQMLLMSGYNIELLHQPSYIHSVPTLDSRQFPSLFLVFGASMIAIRVVGGFVFTRFHRYVLPTIFLSEVTMALSLGLLPFYGTSLPALFVFNVLTGLSFGLAFGLAVPVMISFIGVDLLPLAYGLLIMCCGSASVLFVSLAGMLYDLLGTYRASFHLAGGVTAAGAFFLLLLLFTRPREKDRSTLSDDEASSLPVKGTAA